MRRRRAARTGRTIGIIAAVAAVALATGPHWLAAIGNWLALPGGPRPADAIVVHGGNDARTSYGAALYRQGYAPQLWHTGYAYTQAEVAALLAGESVPGEAYEFLPSTSTWTDATAIARQARAARVSSVLVVTDWWHSRRALCADIRQLDGSGVTILFAPSPAPAGPGGWWRAPELRGPVTLELVKLAFYAARYGMPPWGC